MQLEQLLIDPLLGNPLRIDWKNQTVQGLSTNFYGKVEDGVPIILPQKADSSKSKFHQETKSNFNYVEHYQNDAEVFNYFEEPDEITAGERIRLNEKIMQMINPKQGKILDVGCGGGWLSKALPLNNCELVSLDISHKNVSQTLKNTPHKNHTGIVADVFNLPLKKNSFDYIVASEIIEHLHTPKEFISKLLNVLKPNGKIIITTPYNEKIPIYLCVHCNCPTPRNAHLHSFNEKNILKHLPQNTTFKMETMGNYPMFRFRIYHLLRFLPFSIWKPLDNVANKIIQRPSRFVLTITK